MQSQCQDVQACILGLISLFTLISITYNETSKPLESHVSLEANRFPILDILAAQFQIFFFEWIAPRLRPASLGNQPLADAVGSFWPPSGQQQGVQAFTAKKRADTTAYRNSGLGFFQDALLIFSAVGTPLGFGYHLRIRPRSRPRIGARFGCRCTPLRLASLTFAPFRGSQTPKQRTTARELTTPKFGFEAEFRRQKP